MTDIHTYKLKLDLLNEMKRLINMEELIKVASPLYKEEYPGKMKMKDFILGYRSTDDNIGYNIEINILPYSNIHKSTSNKTVYVPVEFRNNNESLGEIINSAIDKQIENVSIQLKEFIGKSRADLEEVEKDYFPRGSKTIKDDSKKDDSKHQSITDIPDIDFT